MQPFTVYSGVAVPLDRSNVDTDQIVPKEYLKRIERTGFGQFLFHDWRFLPHGKPNPDFEPNRERYAGAGILLAGRNFGCGSSREHAVWALYDYGIRAIIAPSFADIFATNALGNGLLPVVLPELHLAFLTQRTRESPGYRLTVDLERCTVSDTRHFTVQFEIDPFSRYRLLHGLDDIGLTLQHEADITTHEEAPAFRRDGEIPPSLQNAYTFERSATGVEPTA